METRPREELLRRAARIKAYIRDHYDGNMAALAAMIGVDRSRVHKAIDQNLVSHDRLSPIERLIQLHHGLEDLLPDQKERPAPTQRTGRVPGAREAINESGSIQAEESPLDATETTYPYLIIDSLGEDVLEITLRVRGRVEALRLPLTARRMQMQRARAHGRKHESGKG